MPEIRDPARQRLLDEAPIGLAHLSPQGEVLWSNRRLADLLGATPDGLVGRSPSDWWDVDPMQRWREELENGHERMRLELPSPVSADLWLELRLDALRDPGGRIVALAAVLDDITERRRFERYSRAQRSYLDSLDADSPIQFFAVDVGEDGDFRYSYFNRSFETMTALPAGRMLGHTPQECVPEVWNQEQADVVTERYRRCLEQRSPHSFEARWTLADRDGWWFTTLTPVLDDDGRVSRIVGSTIEITHTKRTEEQLRAAQRRITVIAETSSAYLLELDPTGRIRYINRTYENITDEEVAGTNLSQWYPEEIREEAMEPFRQALRTGRPQKQEMSALDANGQVRHWVNDFQPVGTDGGEPRVILTAIDITERKQAEEELRRAHTELALLKERIEAENIYLREDLAARHQHGEIVGRSEELKRVLIQAEKVAPTDATVLILGETGTGKELLARAIHRMSPRHDGPLISVNCAAIPENLIENELFGSEKGAFTGAMTRHIGHFEAAHGGSIFLDEIGDLPLNLQAKLLRVLQNGQVQRLGGVEAFAVDTRVIVATNHDLEERVRQGLFREDLFFRLQVFPLHLPPLRERVSDIPLLISSFVDEMAERMGRRVDQISQTSLQKLQSYDWPGNVRELRNVVERALIESTGPTLEIRVPSRAPEGAGGSTRLADVERDHITRVLRRTNWRVRGQGGAAELLDLHPSTLDFRMKKHGIRRPER